MRVEFISGPLLEPQEDEWWLVATPFEVRIDGTPYAVPAGFRTDLDSVPRLPLVYWMAKGRAKKSAVLHDWLYAIQVPREWADKVMRAAMVTEGVGQPYRAMIYGAVRAFGEESYMKRKKPNDQDVPDTPA